MSRSGDAFAPASRCCEYHEPKLDFAAASNYILTVDSKDSVEETG